MAAARTPEMSGNSGGVSLSGVSDLAALFLPKSTSTNGTQATTGNTSSTSNTAASGSTTVSENVSPDAVMAVVNSILSGSQGLASVASGQRKAGLYGSTTNQMLVNDLIARAAAEGAKLNKSTTSTTNNNQQQQQQQVQQQQVASTQQVKQAPQVPTAVSGTGLGILGALSLANKTGVSDKILQSLGIGGKKAPVINNAASGGGSDASPKSTAGTPTTGESSTPSVATISPTAPVMSAGNDAIGTSLDSSNPVTSNTVDINGIISQPADIMGFDYGSMAGSIADTSGEAAAPVNDFIGSGADVATDIVGSGDGNFDMFAPVPDLTDTNFDFQGFEEQFGNFDLGFAKGGLVSKGKMKTYANYGRPAGYADGGLVDKVRAAAKSRADAADAAYGSGGDAPAPKDKPDNQKEQNPSDYNPKKNLGVRLIDMMKGKGFATGGLVDLTNLGLRTADSKNPAGLDTTSNNASTVASNIRRVANGTSQPGGSKSVNSGSLSPVNTGSRAIATQSTPRNKLREPGVDPESSGESSETAGMATGPTGMDVGVTSGIGSTAAGLAGIVGGLTGNPIGPVAGLAAASNNTQAVASVVGGIAAAITGQPLAAPIISAIISSMSQNNSLDAAANAASSANTAPTAGETTAAMANSISDDTQQDPLDTMVNLITNESITATPDSIAGVSDSSGSSVSASDGSSVGTSGDGGVGEGGSAFSRGGSVKGPGTPTSDSIPIRVSDGEYVINAKAVKALGVDFFDEINNAFRTA